MGQPSRPIMTGKNYEYKNIPCLTHVADGQ